jgi:thiol-disulfide isomerase/thioredoxin
MSTGGPIGGVRHRRARVRSGSALVAGSLLVGTVLAGCGAAGAGRPAATPAGSPGTTVFPAAERRPLPEVTGRTLDGQALTLRDVAGSGVVVINVWASWCTSCRDESAALAAVATELRGQPVRFIGVDEQDPTASAQTFLASTGVSYPQLADPDGDVLAALSLLPRSGIPSTLLVDPGGRMAARVIGPVTHDGLRELIASLSQES